MKDLSAGTNQELLAENAALRRRITELEQAESTHPLTDDGALRELNERLSLALEVGNAGIWEWHLKRDEVRLDDRFHAMLGYAPGELPTTLQEWLSYHHPEDVPIWMAKAEAYLRGESPVYESEHRIRAKTGTWNWVFTRGKLVNPTAAGSPEQFIGIAMNVTERKRVEKQLQDTLESLRKAFGATVRVMVSAVESRDPYTAGHQLRSANLARAIATEIGLTADKIEGIRMAGSIHDIGKLSIPAEILSKSTKLSEIEFSLIQEHARQGFEILKDVESPWPLAEMVYQHHERMDGTGYPKYLKGEEICMGARILAVSDVVESMTSHRPYRPALGIKAALEEIEKNRGTLYDNTTADACSRLFREKSFQLEGI